MNFNPNKSIKTMKFCKKHPKTRLEYFDNPLPPRIEFCPKCLKQGSRPCSPEENELLNKSSWGRT